MPKNDGNAASSCLTKQYSRSFDTSLLLAHRCYYCLIMGRITDPWTKAVDSSLESAPGADPTQRCAKQTREVHAALAISSVLLAVNFAFGSCIPTVWLALACSVLVWSQCPSNGGSRLGWQVAETPGLCKGVMSALNQSGRLAVGSSPTNEKAQSPTLGAFGKVGSLHSLQGSDNPTLSDARHEPSGQPQDSNSNLAIQPKNLERSDSKPTDEELSCQSDSGYSSLEDLTSAGKVSPTRTVDEATKLYKSSRGQELSDCEIIELCARGTFPIHSLEKVLDHDTRAISIRRNVLERNMKENPNMADNPSSHAAPFKLPCDEYDFSKVRGRCAENVIGYMPLPVGVAGPLVVDQEPILLPMATTEGTLIASTSRGCKAINAAGGASSVSIANGMTRAPVVRFAGIAEAAEAKSYVESLAGQELLQKAFRSTTQHGELISVSARMAGSYLYLRFKACTGEAMGMNMVGKGSQAALTALKKRPECEHMEVVSLSGNFCSDKKPSAINWIEGRGQSVVAEAILPPEVVESVLKCSVESLVKLNTQKNYVGSALAGVSAGGFNAHAANIVTAIFLATGQDAAQNVESSNCITMMEQYVKTSNAFPMTSRNTNETLG